MTRWSTRSHGAEGSPAVPRSGWPFAITAGLTLTLLACSSGDESTSETSIAPSATTVESSVPTTVPASTVAETSPTTTATNPPTSSATTTSPPASNASTPTTTSATTTLALDPIEVEVADAYRAAFDSWTECLRTLPNCALDAFAATRADGYLDAAVVQAGRYNDAGQTVEGLETRVTTIESVEFIDDAQARVIACEVDGSVRRDSTGAVINDSFDSARVVFVLSAADGSWKVIGSENLETGSGPEENVCAS